MGPPPRSSSLSPSRSCGEAGSCRGECCRHEGAYFDQNNVWVVLWVNGHEHQDPGFSTRTLNLTSIRVYGEKMRPYLELRHRLREYEAPPPQVREHSLHEPQASHRVSLSSSDRAVRELCTPQKEACVRISAVTTFNAIESRPDPGPPRGGALLPGAPETEGGENEGDPDPGVLSSPGLPSEDEMLVLSSTPGLSANYIMLFLAAESEILQWDPKSIL